MRSYGRIEICLTTVIIQKTVNVLIQQPKKLSANLKRLLIERETNVT